MTTVECTAFPLGSIPRDQHNLPDARGHVVTIPLSQPAGHTLQAEFPTRTVTNGVLDVFNLDPTAPCKVQETIDVIQQSGITIDPKHISERLFSDNCLRCGHQAVCRLRRSNP